MIGYIFETTNLKTGAKYTGKYLSVKFDKNYLGDIANDELARDIEKYGRANFVAKMIMPYENVNALEKAYNSIGEYDQNEPKKRGRKKKEEEVVVDE